MIIDKNTFKVSIDNGTNWTSLAQYLVQVETGYNKLWSSDTRQKFSTEKHQEH